MTNYKLLLTEFQTQNLSTFVSAVLCLHRVTWASSPTARGQRRHDVTDTRLLCGHHCLHHHGVGVRVDDAVPVSKGAFSL